MKKRYEIRCYPYKGAYSKNVSPKLRERKRANKLVKYLRKRFGMDVFAAQMGVNI